MRSIESMTLRMNPEGFQLGVAGCAWLFSFVQRTIRLTLPDAGGVNWVCHCRKPYLPASIPSCVGCQLLPPSVEMSTRATPQSPPKAMPRASTGATTGTVAPERRLVTKDRGTILLIGTMG